jgi:ERCC4-type nuclease
MKIKIDTRESKLFNEINKKNIPENCTVIKKTMPLGDIIIANDDDLEILIIERKTLRDLAASIKDGRYTEQSFRLNNCNCHNHNIIYLIEGLLTSFKEERGIKKKNYSISYFWTKFF